MKTKEEILLKNIGKAFNNKSVFHQRYLDAMEEYAKAYHSQHTLSREKINGLIHEHTDTFCTDSSDRLVYRFTIQGFNDLLSALASPTAEKVDKVEPGEQKEYCKYCGYTTIHKNGICVVCESQPQPEVSDEEIEKEAERYATLEGGEDFTPMIAQPDYLAFYDGAKWMRKQLTGK